MSSYSLRSNPSRSSQPKPFEEFFNCNLACNCTLDHISLEACLADPESKYNLYSELDTESEEEIEEDSEEEIINMGSSSASHSHKRKASPLREEPRSKKGKGKGKVVQCECGSHESQEECDEERENKRGEVVMSVMVGAQTFVTIHVGDEPKQTFQVPKELLTLFSEYFRRLLVQGKDDQKRNQIMAKASTTSEGAIDLTNLPDEIEPAAKPITNSFLAQVMNPEPASVVARVATYDLKKTVAQVSTYNLAKTFTLVSPLRMPLAVIGSESTTEITVPNIHPTHFAAFVCFLYTGKAVIPKDEGANDDEEDDEEATDPSDFLASLYMLAVKIGSADYQNVVMDALQRNAEEKSGGMTAAQAKHVYFITSDVGGKNEGAAMLRRFTAACIAATNPFEMYEEGSDESEEWTKLYSEMSAISLDVHKAGSKRWIESKPWDKKNRDEFFWEEEDLQERWNQQLLEFNEETGILPPTFKMRVL